MPKTDDEAGVSAQVSVSKKPSLATDVMDAPGLSRVQRQLWCIDGVSALRWPVPISVRSGEMAWKGTERDGRDPFCLERLGVEGRTEEKKSWNKIG